MTKILHIPEVKTMFANARQNLTHKQFELWKDLCEIILNTSGLSGISVMQDLLKELKERVKEGSK